MRWKASAAPRIAPGGANPAQAEANKAFQIGDPTI